MFLRMSLQYVHAVYPLRFISSTYLFFQAHGASAITNEEPLPAGWGMSVAPNGRVFYINHNNRQTTWVSFLQITYTCAKDKEEKELFRLAKYC